MKTESELKLAGIPALIAPLRPVDAERFIAALHREPFHYTRWRSEQWQDATVAALADQARATCAGGGIGLRLVRFRLLEDLLGANQENRDLSRFPRIFPR